MSGDMSGYNARFPKDGSVVEFAKGFGLVCLVILAAGLGLLLFVWGGMWLIELMPWPGWAGQPGWAAP